MCGLTMNPELKQGDKMDTYQPIFDAVRSKLTSCDTGEAISRAVSSSGLDHAVGQITEIVRQAVGDYQRPSVLYKPRLFIDGDQWCAMYGTTIQGCVTGFGDSPAEAMSDFDDNFTEKINE